MLVKSKRVVDGTINMLNNPVYRNTTYNFLGICINPQGYCIAATYLDVQSGKRYLTDVKSGVMILSQIKKDLSEIIEQSFMPQDKFIDLIKKTIESETNQDVLNRINPFRKDLYHAIEKYNLVKLVHTFYVVSDLDSKELPGSINTKKQAGQTYSIDIEYPLAESLKSFCCTVSLINEEKLVFEHNSDTNITKKIKNELSSIRSHEDIKNLSPQLIAINYAIGDVEYRRQIKELKYSLTAENFGEYVDNISIFVQNVAEHYRNQRFG